MLGGGYYGPPSNHFKILGIKSMAFRTDAIAGKTQYLSGLIEGAGYIPAEYSSGNGSCVSFTIPREESLLASIGKLVSQLEDSVFPRPATILTCARFLPQSGGGYLVYFPDFPWKKLEESD